MRMKTLLRSSLLGVVMTMGLCMLVVPGCRTDAEAVCDYKCDCEGCSDQALDDCYFHEQSDEREADNKGCLDYYDELKACEYDTWFCKSGNDFETSCGTEKDRYNNCRK
jgi:hypothetical protein